MRKQLKKFVAVKFHHFGQNKHAFWDGRNWVLNEESSVFFNDRDQAAEVSKENKGRGDFLSVVLEF